MDELLLQALTSYGLATARAQSLNGLWNQVYYVEDEQGRKYSLRICAAAYRDKQVLSDEMEWLAFIEKRYPQLAPRPVSNIDGENVTLLSTSEGARFCCLFDWIDGEVAGSNLTTSLLYEIGRTVALLHQVARAFAFPSPENSFRRNYEYGRGLAIAHREWIEAHRDEIEVADFELMQEAVTWLIARFDEIGETPQNFGFIHADLHFGNFLVHKGVIHVIDFDQLGRGHYLYDIAQLRVELQEDSEHFPEYWASFQRGYQTVTGLPFEKESELDMFIVAVRLAFLDWVFNSSEQRVRQTKMPLVAANLESIRMIVGSSAQ